ncbi:MAG: sigma-70 family RNA polymerase sigma factor [Roseiflexaceae bacterium]|nr:sigma-70 family RNA polymerase sigma factor [Roseiflexaceae bacterium]
MDKLNSTAEPSTDEQVGVLLQQQDARSIIGLSQRAGRLNTILTRQFGTYISAEDMKDIVGDTLIQAVRKGRRYDPHLSSLMRWLTVLGHYRALHFLREAALFSSATLDEVADHMSARIEERPQEVTEVPSGTMERLLRRLTKQQAKVIRWHFYDGLTIDEIAGLLNVDIVTIRSHKSRGLDSLRDMMSSGPESE